MSNTPISDFKQKWYIKQLSGNNPQLTTKHVNILGIGLGDQVKELFCDCKRINERHEENMNKTVWKCGELNVVDINDVKNTSEAQEEMKIILTGERRFGESMRPSGWFSHNVLGRKYGREIPTNNSQVHAIFIGSKPNLPINIPNNTAAPFFQNSLKGVDEMACYMKRKFLNEIVQSYKNEISKSYDSGYQDGKKQSSNDSYEKGLKDGYLNGIKQASDDAYVKGLKDGYQKCNKNK